MYHLHTRAGELPRSASSHFSRNHNCIVKTTNNLNHLEVKSTNNLNHLEMKSTNNLEVKSTNNLLRITWK